MKPEFFDVHSHIQDKSFNDDRINVIKKMQTDNVWSVVVGTGIKSSQQAVDLSSIHNNLFASVGIHPNDDKEEQFQGKHLKAFLEKEKVVAVGECGLDYYRKENDTEEERKRQRKLLEKHIELAVSTDRPLMIHCRGAHKDMIDILSLKKKKYGEKLKGNIHFFTAPPEIAKKYLEMEFTLSFSGLITFASVCDDVIKYAPLNMILSETDSPFVAPVPHRGKRNEPIYVKEVVKKIMELRYEDTDKTKKTLVDNALRLFKRPEVA